MTSWKEQLGDRIPDQLAGEVDLFEGQIELKKQGKLDDKIFAETRLRRGVYGQRYDNGLRDDGTGQKTLTFPCGDLTKGPDTVWDAPGMMRIKIPFGKLTAEQLRRVERARRGELRFDPARHDSPGHSASLHSHRRGPRHDAPARVGRDHHPRGLRQQRPQRDRLRVRRRLQHAGLRRHAVRQRDHAVPVGSPRRSRLWPQVQDRFLGLRRQSLWSRHLPRPRGGRARSETARRGFRVVVGGGLGAVPVQAKVLAEFCPEEELFPLTQAVARVFARLGEKQSRARARIKFLVQKVGIDDFKKLVAEERETLRPDERWTNFLDDLHSTDEKPVREAGASSERHLGWLPGVGQAQPQAPGAGRLLLRDRQDAARRLHVDTGPRARASGAGVTGDSIRCTVEQNMTFRWLSGADAVTFYDRLVALNMAAPGAGTITDMTSCPGTDTCKLGISASRGLTASFASGSP